MMGEKTMTKKEKIWNVPNVLTMLRMALIPVFWYFMMGDRLYAALGVFVAASLTDVADGYIARKYDLITDFGKLMDPLADKLMVISMLCSLVIKGIAPWPALAIIVAKELTMVTGGLILLKHQVVVHSIWIGKIAQTVVVCGLISCFFHEWLGKTFGFPVHTALLWLGVAFTISALCVYMRRAIGQYREAKEKEKEQK